VAYPPRARLPAGRPGQQPDPGGRLTASTDSPEHWRDVRRLLNSRRHELTATAARLYPSALRVGSTPLLSRPQWLPPAPLDLGRIRLAWQQNVPPGVDPAAQASAGVRPLLVPGLRYGSYAEALAAIERPRLLEDRVSYRLLSASLAGAAPRLTLTRGRYFDGVNAGEAVAHELAAAWREDPRSLSPERLPLRALLGDPCDLGRRSALPAITTLTLRVPAAGQPTFLLHWRDPASVAHAGGLYQVMPVGVFQPAGRSAEAERRDFDLWRCMAREFSEELLGTPEDYGTGPLDYPGWPLFGQLCAARDAGLLGVWCLGLGADPLTLATDILAAAVFAGDAFDALFGGLVAANDEGRVVSWPGLTGVPFTADVVARFAGGSEPMQPAGAAVLELAWRHRARLLG
jgi:hypothetical protein